MAIDDNPGFASLIGMAERELCAFITAVKELYGPEQAKISAGDWLAELESIDDPAELTSRALRLITIAAAARLANRLIVVGQPVKTIEKSRLQTKTSATRD